MRRVLGVTSEEAGEQKSESGHEATLYGRTEMLRKDKDPGAA